MTAAVQEENTNTQKKDALHRLGSYLKEGVTMYFENYARLIEARNSIHD